MLWTEQITMAELTSVCPELSNISTEHVGSPDELIALVRQDIATEHFTVRTSMKFYPNPREPEGRTKHIEQKNFKKKEVVEFDRIEKKYWSYVKQEIYSLVCTKDRKYSTIRAKLQTIGPKGHDSIVALIAAYIGKSLGVAEGVVSALVAIALFASVKLGVNAYCAWLAADLKSVESPNQP